MTHGKRDKYIGFYARVTRDGYVWVRNQSPSTGKPFGDERCIGRVHHTLGRWTAVVGVTPIWAYGARLPARYTRRVDAVNDLEFAYRQAQIHKALADS